MQTTHSASKTSEVSGAKLGKEMIYNVITMSVHVRTHAKVDKFARVFRLEIRECMSPIWTLFMCFI